MTVKSFQWFSKVLSIDLKGCQDYRLLLVSRRVIVGGGCGMMAWRAIFRRGNSVPGFRAGPLEMTALGG